MSRSKPKLIDVAQLAGVSVTTASQVIRGTGRISEKTVVKVKRAAEQLNYVPNAMAASMRSGTSNEIGFVINQISNPFNAEVISGVSDRLEIDGFLLSVLDARDDPDRQEKHLKAFIKSRRAGLLWVPALGTKKELFTLLESHKTPAVTFLRSTRFSHFDHVGIANADATYRATSHLIDLGHRHIAYLGGTLMAEVREQRISGYKRALESIGEPPLVWDCEDRKSTGLEAILELRRGHPQITAVVCNGDMVALGAELGLQRMGLTAGIDFSIVGFDDVEDAAVSTPPLTTMSVCPYQLGRRLAATLLDRLNDPDAPVTSTEVTAELVIRATTGELN